MTPAFDSHELNAPALPFNTVPDEILMILPDFWRAHRGSTAAQQKNKPSIHRHHAVPLAGSMLSYRRGSSDGCKDRCILIRMSIWPKFNRGAEFGHVFS